MNDRDTPKKQNPWAVALAVLILFGLCFWLAGYPDFFLHR